MRLAVIAAALGGCILAVVACSSTPTGPDGTDAGQDAADTPDAADAADGSAPLPYPLDQVCAPTTEPGLDACAKCGRESCCDTRTRIFATDAGSTLVDCMKQDACGETCRRSCFDSAPGETKPYLEHLTCLSHRCMEECAGPWTACATCQEANCLRESLACDLSRECLIHSSCFNACKGVDTCADDCNTRYPAAPPLLNALVLCTANNCAQECQ